MIVMMSEINRSYLTLITKIIRLVSDLSSTPMHVSLKKNLLIEHLLWRAIQDAYLITRAARKGDNNRASLPIITDGIKGGLEEEKTFPGMWIHFSTDKPRGGRLFHTSVSTGSPKEETYRAKHTSLMGLFRMNVRPRRATA